MTIIEKQLIRSLVLSEITKETFLESYPVDLARDSQYVLSLLESAYKEQNTEDMEYALMLLPLDNFIGTSKYVDILNKLILVNWHNMHEDIAALLEGIKLPESVVALFKAATVHHDYLDYDDTYQLARKCIKALSAINNEEAIEKLQALSLSDISEIAAYARKELDRKGL